VSLWFHLNIEVTMSPKKRASAFDDFPGGQESGAQESQQPAAAPARPVQPAQENQVERIERLKPSQMLPDRFQPRRLLPTGIRSAFFSGRIDCYRAASEWLALAQKESGYLAEIERLLAMGDSFSVHGQIKAITGSWSSLPDGRYVFFIETGERRFWAACLQAVREKRAEEPLLRVEAVSRPTRQRQVLENRHAEPPSAVGQACEVAALILAELGIQPNDRLADDYDYFRQARAQRMPAGLWERITPVMQLTRPRMVQLLNILALPTALLELADRHRLAERVLREVLALPQAQWEKVLRSSILNQLTSEEVAEIPRPEPQKKAARPARRAPFEPGRTAVSGLRGFASVLIELDEVSQAQALDEAADILVSTGEAGGMMNLLGELARCVEMRLSRK
jgi:hypothetical protein